MSLFVQWARWCQLRLQSKSSAFQRCLYQRLAEWTRQLRELADQDRVLGRKTARSNRIEFKTEGCLGPVLQFRGRGIHIFMPQSFR